MHVAVMLVVAVTTCAVGCRKEAATVSAKVAVTRPLSDANDNVAVANDSDAPRVIERARQIAKEQKLYKDGLSAAVIHGTAIWRVRFTPPVADPSTRGGGFEVHLAGKDLRLVRILYLP